MNCCCLLSEVAISECFLCWEALGLFRTGGICGRIHPAVAEGTRRSSAEDLASLTSCFSGGLT